MSKSARSWMWLGAGLCLGMLSSTQAYASPLFELTGGIGDQAGFGARDVGGSAASAYFNPALLTKARSGFYTGFFMLSDQLAVSLDGRPGGDVPTAFRGSTHADGSVIDPVPVPTAWLRSGCNPPECRPALEARPRQTHGTSGNTRPYQAIGLVVPIVPERLIVGFYSLLPLEKFTTAHSFFVDEREQYFTNSLHHELYSDRLTATSLALGLGLKVAGGLSLGASITLSLHNGASAETFVANADDIEHSLMLATNVGVKVALAPHFGLNYDITESVHAALTLHTVQRFDIATGFSTFLPNGNRQSATRQTVHDYLPVQIGLGAAWDVANDGEKEPRETHELTLHANAVFGFWSNYVDRQNERPKDDYAWSNTLNLVVGARHSYGHLRSFLDAVYVPSPVPLQTGRSNYVDSDRIGAGAGFDVDFKLFDIPFRLGAQAQVHAVMSRYQQKLLPGQGGDTVRDEFPDDAVDSRSRPISTAAGLQTNNPGWPGFSSSGFLIGGAINLAVLL